MTNKMSQRNMMTTLKGLKFLSRFVILLGFFSFTPVTLYADQIEIPQLNRRIVVFKVKTDSFSRESAIRRAGAAVGDRLDIIHGISVKLTPEAEQKLKNNPYVERIDPDEKVLAVRHSQVVRPQVVSQATPWNITKIFATQAWSLAKGTNVEVGIVDTGISTSHPDLIVVGGVNTINARRSYNDDNGHGSHVAGSACARDNNFGVVGVAPECSLYAIKVLNAAGSGFVSDIIEGIQWSVNKGIKVTNMSLGLGSNIQSLADAISAADQAGLVQVAAAGNNGPGQNTTLYPANYGEVISVAATDSNDNVPSWSSRGKVDIAAPGVNIYSTYKGNKYATLSGTSMAAPHVTGVVALRKQLKPLATPSELKTILQSNADPLPYDATTVGAGRVNAQKVVEAL